MKILILTLLLIHLILTKQIVDSLATAKTARTTDDCIEVS
jgi:hypothetical protein